MPTINDTTNKNAATNANDPNIAQANPLTHSFASSFQIFLLYSAIGLPPDSLHNINPTMIKMKPGHQ